jgi:2-polyprenyl-6-methoxyphenol hydroxylase-like FAD-dependent oxidoreductase
LLEETELDPSLRDYFFSQLRLHLFAFNPFHLVVYPVPGREGNLTPGQRRLNWGWYFRAPAEQVQTEFLRDRWGQAHPYSLAPGQVSPQTLSYLQPIAQTVWPEAAQALINLTIAQDRLFMQVIYDYMPSVLAVGRVCLLGDAAHVASPITGSGARMAMLDSLALAVSLRQFAGGNTVEVASALRHFEQQRLQPARQLVAYGRQWGSDFGYRD